MEESNPAVIPTPDAMLENRRTWNAWTPLHIDSRFYDVDGFRNGREPLDEIEIRGAGEVRGRSLLHLQCHFGLSTLSFARKGARVTGVDFSGEAIAFARDLAAELGLPAEFIESNIYDLPAVLQAEFDVVFTSHGVLPWLPDLERWAAVVARFVKPGGRFFLMEGHPVLSAIDDRPDGDPRRFHYPYFGGREAWRFENTGSYAAPDAPVRTVAYEWFHSLGDIIGSLLRAGLRITDFEEYPFCAWEAFPGMTRRPDGFWGVPEGSPSMPLSFALSATRDG